MQIHAQYGQENFFLSSSPQHRVLRTQIKCIKMESTNLLSCWMNPLEWATSAAYVIVSLCSIGDESHYSHYWDLSHLYFVPDLRSVMTKLKSFCTICWMPLPCQIKDVPPTTVIQRPCTILPIDLTWVSSKAENAFVVWAEKEIPSNPVTTMASFFSAWNLSFYTSIWNRWQMDVKMGHGGFCVTCHLCQGWEMCVHGDPPGSAFHVLSSCWYCFVKTEGFEFSGLIFGTFCDCHREKAY